MSHLTTAQATKLVNEGTILRRLINEVYDFHKFSGTLDGAYYEAATPQQYDLNLNADTTLEQAKAAFITHFKEAEHLPTPPTIEDATNW